MLTPEENALLTQVGPGTPMGDLMRQYWLPVLCSSELEAGGRIKRVKILSEELVAFRTQGGTVGLMGEFCPHRWASLYFGRIEETGLRCVYHGWQFGFDGQCLDMPNEPPESDFKEKVCHAAYPCAERGGVVWAYMGPSSSPPGLPDLEWTLVPDEHRFVSKFFQYCGFMQTLEGGVDPAHISFLHGVVDTADDALIADFDRAAAGFGQSLKLRRAPYLEVADTEYGVLIGAKRDTAEDMAYWRIT
jgi:phthalate 4,5-dioxygenase oxygenase subunit